MKLVLFPCLGSCLSLQWEILFWGAFAKLLKATTSFFMSVCPFQCNNSAPTGHVFTEFYIWAIFENLSGKYKFHKILIWITGILHVDHFKFRIVSRWILLRTRNVSDKCCRESPSTHSMFSNFFFFRKSYHLWDYLAQYRTAGLATDDNIIRRMRISWTIKATNTHSEYIILTALARQQWLRALASILRYTCTACLVHLKDRCYT
jgi:hypothetical protein